MLNIILIVLGKIVLLLSRTLNLGAGSTWPGHIAMETNPRFVRQLLKRNGNLKVVIVAGTNGKTTTSLMLQNTLEEDGLKVFRNEAGANLLNGIASTIIANANLTGRLNFDIAIFEVDERNVSLAVKEFTPYAILLLNIFRDQLDRYGEVNQVLNDWEFALSNIKDSTLLFTNGDDPALSNLARNSKIKSFFFGVDNKDMTKDKIEHDVDFIYCPICQTKLDYEKVSFSHMGKFKCPNCKFTNPETETFPDLPQPLLGLYSKYNRNAAALVALLAFNASIKAVVTTLLKFKPAFGRQETITYKRRRIIILLSKNPTGFNQSIDTLNEMVNNVKHPQPNILIVLNDRIPDGRDVSWIWDVDFEKLPKNSNLLISGDRAYDMGLRIRYENRDKDSKIFEDLRKAIEESISQTPEGKNLYILPTYSAMLETRKILTGRSIL